ncbi:hypothetical protein VVD49_12695 [Uliginosibacterium sp. H3]|uniref:Uncharacterized protein n=1 Tax=Uliginosibacterium silvisoli TaxID=3114758 RepID=A0ABU6K555_9RHOO|nr:hypothetical protein [Uliginosibacterium sp. H3]
MAHRRIGRHGRKNVGLLALVQKGDWRIAVALAFVVAVIGLWMLPVWLRQSPVLAQLPAVLKPISWGLFGVFTLAAIMKFRFARRAEHQRRMREHARRDEGTTDRE